MADTIVGLSILQPVWFPDVYRLWFTALKGSGEKNQGWIFIRDSVHNHVPEKLPDYPEGCNTIWKFTRRDRFLDCSPSVNWISWGFHNSGTWSTEYLEMTTPEKPAPYESKPPHYDHGSSVHYSLSCIPPETQHEFIAELRAGGFLK